MGTLEQVQQLAATTSAPESFTLVMVILGALFTVIGGSYIFTWLVFMEMRKGIRDLWKAVSNEIIHDLADLDKRMSKLEK